MELHLSNTRNIAEFSFPRGIVFLDTAKVYYGDINDLKIKVSFFKERGMKSKEFQLSKFYHKKESAIYVVDFKKYINYKSWINISESTQVRFSITNYVEHRTELKLVLIEF